jgi:membrane associated rhomboid family serine protease
LYYFSTGIAFVPMPSDRFYMRNDYARPRTTMLVWMVSIFSASFVLQLVLLSPKLRPMAQLMDKMDLTINALKDGELWTLVTHSLLGSPLSIVFTVISLIFLGRELEPLLGSRRFAALFSGSIVFGALCWTAVHWQYRGSLVGASAAILALLVVLARINADMEMTMLLFPVSFRLQHVVWVILGVEILAFAFYEIFGAAAPLGLTPSADLGGMLAGWLFFRFVHTGAGWDRAGSLSLPRWLRFKENPKPAGKLGQVPTTPSRSGNLRADVDRILDKINSQGFGSLTDEEKQILDDAKDLLSKH